MTPIHLIARWNAFPRAVRIVGGVALTAAIALTIAVPLARPHRMPLFATPLYPEQLSEVEENLASWNVAFTPSSDNVSVDAKRRNDLLLRLSLAGVPHGHIDRSGDMLAKLGALTPQTVIDEQARDGLAGDIEAGLRGVDGVQDAQVIIAPAKPGYFANDAASDASAGVRLRLAAGAQLSQNAIAGIRSYVAASVPALQENRVTIVDDRGIALGSQTAVADEPSDVQRSLQTALDATLGAGASIVRVHEAHQGQQANITAAVFVDAARGADLRQVRSLASSALGIDQRAIDVESMAFARPPPPKSDAGTVAYAVLVPLLPTVIVAVAALIALRWSVPAVQAAIQAAAKRAGIARTAATVRGFSPANVRGALKDEPPHAAAAIISALPAATAAAVLDMYPDHERTAIIQRMQRPHSPLIPDVESFIAQN